jgi:ribosomal protein S18 acetylase RimI-like enzyme
MHIQTGPAPNLTHGRHPHDCGHGRRPKPAAQSNPRTSCAGADRHITTGRNRVSGTYGLEHDGQSAEIAQVYVHPKHRGRGIGTALTRAAIDAAGAVRDLWIVADDEDRPKDLYARLGFRPAWVAVEALGLP